VTAFEFIESYCDPVPFTLPVSTRKKVLIDGKQLQYGPALSGTLAKTDAGYSVTLDSVVTVEFKPGVHAKVSGFDITPEATFASGTVGPFGLIAFHEKVNLSFGDA
jgi:hypothetical protein